MSVLLLAIAYAVVAALVLNLCLSKSWPTRNKIGLVMLVSALYVGSYLGLREIQGWPTREPLPEDFRLLWAHVEEPDKASGSEGKIYLWVRAVDEAGRAVGEPRAYRLPWSLATAEQVAGALQRTQDGEPLNGSITRQPLQEKPDVEPNEKPRGSDQSAPPGLEGEVAALVFSELPKTSMPAKAD